MHMVAKWFSLVFDQEPRYTFIDPLMIFVQSLACKDVNGCAHERIYKQQDVTI